MPSDKVARSLPAAAGGTDELLAGVTKLYACHSGLQSLEGLQRFSSLRWLYLDHNQLGEAELLRLSGEGRGVAPERLRAWMPGSTWAQPAPTMPAANGARREGCSSAQSHGAAPAPQRRRLCRSRIQPAGAVQRSVPC